MEEHRGHDTVSAVAERTERQRELRPTWLNIQQWNQDTQQDIEMLQQHVKAISVYIDKAVREA